MAVVLGARGRSCSHILSFVCCVLKNVNEMKMDAQMGMATPMELEVEMEVEMKSALARAELASALPAKGRVGSGRAGCTKRLLCK